MRTNAAKAGQLSPIAAARPAQSAKRQGLRWFVRAPARMALDRGVSAVAFRLATVLLHYEGELGCFPSQERLSEDLGISVDSVQRYLRELELYGFLVVEKRGRRNNYRLEPVYEPPIERNSIDETSQLEIENRPKRQPPSPRTLRSRPVVNTRAEEVPSKKAAPARSIGRSLSQGDLAAPVRPIEAVETIRSMAPVRSVNAAPLRPDIVERPHLCGTKKNQLDIKNQHQQDASPTDDGGHLEEKHGVTEGIAALQRVGVNIVATDLGSLGGRDRGLLDVVLLEWASWIQSPNTNGILNKNAFAASRIRLGFTVRNTFPDYLDRVTLERQHNLSIARKDIEEDAAVEMQRESNEKADAFIASLDATTRQNLRAKALHDPAVYIGRNLSPAVFDRLVTAIERRLATYEN